MHADTMIFVKHITYGQRWSLCQLTRLMTFTHRPVFTANAYTYICACTSRINNTHTCVGQRTTENPHLGTGKQKGKWLTSTSLSVFLYLRLSVFFLSFCLLASASKRLFIHTLQRSSLSLTFSSTFPPSRPLPLIPSLPCSLIPAPVTHLLHLFSSGDGD